MNILVLGASSAIGSSIVKSFANNNKLFLLSRKRENLETLRKEALALGSQSVKIIEADLQNPIVVTELISESIDMIINVACASSSTKNYNIEHNRYQYYTAVDLSSPLVILEHYLKEKSKQGEKKQLYYIFINTILSKIPLILCNFFNEETNEYTKRELVLVCKKPEGIDKVIESIIKSNPATEDRIKKFIKDFLYKGDGCAGERISNQIIHLLEEKKKNKK